MDVLAVALALVYSVYFCDEALQFKIQLAILKKSAEPDLNE